MRNLPFAPAAWRSVASSHLGATAFTSAPASSCCCTSALLPRQHAAWRGSFSNSEGTPDADDDDDDVDSTSDPESWSNVLDANRGSKSDPEGCGPYLGCVKGWVGGIAWG